MPEITEITPRRRALVLAICCMSLFVVGVDITIVNIALPAIGHDFGASVSGLQWIMDAYTLVLASFFMLADRLSASATILRPSSSAWRRCCVA